MSVDRHGDRARSFSAPGFTLIEMVVVLAVLAGAAAVAGVAARPLRERSLVARSARTIEALVVRAQALAVRDGRPSLVRFAEAGAITIPGTRHRVQLDPALTLSVTTIREAGPADEQALMFLPDGTGTGGVLRLAIAGRDAPTRTLRISWLTGAVTDAP
ncbi:prepilin-type N-terminal cleavage/methylation domain-containing protein [Methylobacterium mesophilicum]|uniref:prepilin-type N-terminal cleavage/methylation domain-containing protein n=1 Tax=Methylobacterium mesophilicum TaxID=39956 RepID=UPI002F349F6C